MSRKPQPLRVPKDNLAAMRELMELDPPTAEFESEEPASMSANKSSNVQIIKPTFEHLNKSQEGETKTDTRLSVQLSDVLHTRLKEYCVVHKLSIRTLITTLIEKHLEEQKNQL